MKIRWLLVTVLLTFGMTLLVAQPQEYESMKQEAEKYFAEGSFERAHQIYGSIDISRLPATEARWVQFRVADTLWRSQAATTLTDATKLDHARQELEKLVRDITEETERDRVWAEVQESLGDFYWTRRDQRNWGQAWHFYQQALEWWAASDELELARDRYLNIIWAIANPPHPEPYYYYGYYGNMAPLEVLQNALKIAETKEEIAHAHYLIAMTLRQQGDHTQRKRAPKEFEAALKAGKANDWYDDALYHYAEWMMRTGAIVRTESGQWRQEPDFVRAVELFRRLISEHGKGETRYYDQAKQQIENITKPVVQVTVANLFSPGSEIEYHLHWRNTPNIRLNLYRIDLIEDVRFEVQQSSGTWLQLINVAGRKPAKSWLKVTEDKGEHKPGQERLLLDERLPAGAYLLEAKIDGAAARDLVLVTDASLVLKTSGRKALIYYCNASSGSPVAGANVRVWERYYDGSQYVWRPSSLTTGQDGLAMAQLMESQSNSEIFVAAAHNGHSAFAIGNVYNYRNPIQEWRIFAYTDKPAYRPGEKAQWKFTARQYDGSVYTTPAGQTVEYEIYDPRGAKVYEQVAKLNAFGSAWNSLDLTDSMPLGEYGMRFYNASRQNIIGQATLFRLEEYKLPEFRVSVRTPEENGKRKIFRSGDTVEVEVLAEYYFGGGVSNANVEVLVYQNPFHHWWSPAREYAWYYDEIRPQHWYGNGQIVKQEIVKTDASGRAVLTFDTPQGTPQDFQYRIEARVTDSSRREVTASETVKVTRQGYFVYPKPKHSVYKPQDRVTVDIKVVDANDQPVQVEGSVKVTRDYWFEIWIDPSGKEIKGDELETVRGKISNFPGEGWKLKFRGYQHDEILNTTVKTDAEGEAEFVFRPERDGYYRVHWTSEDQDVPVVAEATVWVADRATTELGYRHGGVEIIVDKDTFRSGETATVLLVAPTNDRYVLLSIEGENLYSYRLVHLTGTVKRVEIPIEEDHVPNVFLNAILISDRQMFTDIRQVVVPPVRHFLEVDVKPDRNPYQPREEGTLTVTTRNSEGKPVAAEVGFGLVDESVYSIQSDYAGDPRQFYFGTKRLQRTQIHSTLQFKQYSRKEIAGEERKDEEGRDYEMDRLRSLGYLADSAAPMELSAVVAKSEVAMRESPAPAPAPPPPVAAGVVGGQAPEQAFPNVVVRSDFRSTVVWQPDVTTGTDGTAIVRVKYPDSLTTWKATARVATATNEFGIGSSSTRTRQPLIIRLQAPRFYVVGDRVTVSAVINNNTETALAVTPAIEVEGVTLSENQQGSVTVEANGEKRVDWGITVDRAGSVRIKVTALGKHYSDAMEKIYTVYEHGIEKFVAKSGKVRANDVSVILEIPAERKEGSTSLIVQVTPSMAVTMLDALPYLIDYPYGCTEQTMSRFLPAAIVRRTLNDLGLSSADVEGKIFGGVEPQFAKKTHSEGKREIRKVNDMIREGLQRLYDFQHSDGGWGWWKEGESDHFMTAYVVWGLNLAQKSGMEIRSDVLNRGAGFLQKELVEEEEAPDLQAWMLHALSSHHATPSTFEQKALTNLWNNREKLNAYTRALVALSAHAFGDREKAQVLVRNLENGVKIDSSPDTSIVLRGNQTSSESVIGTAHWGEDGIYWRWSDGGVEATAFALRALLAIDPKNKLIEPVTNWLIKNRRGAQWSNTRDTAIVVLTMTDYLRKSGELSAESEFEVSINGKIIGSQLITPARVLSSPSRFSVDPSYIKDGKNEIRIRKKSGNAPLYFAAYATYFSLEEPITAAGNEIFVRRQYHKYVGKPTLLKGYVYDRRPLNDGDSIKSGERIEVTVTIEAKNNYEYLVFEDLKPAGFEAVQLRSGEPLHALRSKSSEQRWVYQELRDRKVALFIDKLPEGIWEIRYDLRAETPGSFHALPLLGHAMYVPEIRANDVESRITVHE